MSEIDTAAIREGLPGRDVVLALCDALDAATKGLPAWTCPNCGAETRARMADHPAQIRPHPFVRDPMFPDDGTPHACRECWAHEGAAWHTPDAARAALDGEA